MEELEQFVLQAFRNAENEIDHSITLRMDALAQFIQGLSAEVNNKLTPILASLQMLLSDDEDLMDEEERRESYAGMREEALKIQRTVDELENFAKPRKPKKNACSLKTTIDRAIAEAMIDSRNKVPVEHRYAGVGKKAIIDQEQMVRALAAVIRILKENADEKEGKVLVASSMPGDERIEMMVEGINTVALGEEAQQAFIPLYLRNVVRFGHEIGLAAAYGLIKAHGGSVTIETLPQGTRFLVTIPQEET
jgi:signal transduction histidine kinase